MRISDWSSDVCSSDLRPFPPIWPRIMQIPGHIDPVTTGTVPLRGGNRIDLVGLTRDAIGGVLVEAGLHAKVAKLRAKQLRHWIYSRGVNDITAMNEIDQKITPWTTDRTLLGRPQDPQAQDARKDVTLGN